MPALITRYRLLALMIAVLAAAVAIAAIRTGTHAGASVHHAFYYYG